MFKPLVRIQDIDHGYRHLFKEVVNNRLRLVAEVGVLGAKAAATRGAGGETNADIASKHEFGVPGRIPKRSFIGGWFDENKQDNAVFAKKLARERLLGRSNINRSLQLMGARSVGGIQKRMSRGIGPANSPSTIARKGSSKPLIDTGFLRSSIAYRVVQA